MPYFCHTHQGIYVNPEPGGHEEGCQHAECVRYRALDIPPLGMIPATVPGGANDTKEYRFHKDFDKGMYEYESAKKAGIQPKNTLPGAAEEAEKQVYSQAAGLKKIEQMSDTDTSKLETAKGVR